MVRPRAQMRRAREEANVCPDLAQRAYVERRLHLRFPIHGEVRYRIINHAPISTAGVGEACNLSTGGICFHTDQRLQEGDQVEMFVDCPLTVAGAFNVQLTVSGTIVRATASEVAVHILDYEFLTRPRDAN